MEPKRKFCIFCDDPQGFKGDEHLISAWIQRRLDAKDIVAPWVGRDVQHGADLDELIYTKVDEGKIVANHDSIRSGYVCDRCNSDLGRELEVPFSLMVPDLLTLKAIDDQQPSPLTLLTNEEKQLLARWAAKTTVVMESIAPLRKRDSDWIDADARQIRSDNVLPNGWAVFACLHLPTSPIFIDGTRTWFVDNDAPAVEKAKLNRRPRSLIQIGSLILLTVYLGESELTLQAVAGLHYPLVVNHEIEWLERPRVRSVRGAEGENRESSINIALNFSDTLSLRK